MNKSYKNIILGLSTIVLGTNFCCTPNVTIAPVKNNHTKTVKESVRIDGASEAAIEDLKKEMEKTNNAIEYQKLLSGTLKEDMEKNYSEFENNRDEQRAINEAFKKRMSKTDAQMAVFEGKFKNINKKFESIDNSITVVETGLKSIKKEFDKNIEDFKKKNEDLEKEIADAVKTGDFAKYEAAMKKWQNDYEKNVKDLTNEAARIDKDSRASIKAMETTIKDTETRLRNETSDAVKNAKEDLEKQLKDNIDKINTDISDINTKIRDNKKEIDDKLTSEIKSVSDNIKTAIAGVKLENENKVKELKTELEKEIEKVEKDSKKEIEDLKRKKKESAESLANFIKKTKGETNKKIEDLKKKNAEEIKKVKEEGERNASLLKTEHDTLAAKVVTIDTSLGTYMTSTNTKVDSAILDMQGKYAILSGDLTTKTNAAQALIEDVKKDNLKATKENAILSYINVITMGKVIDQSVHAEKIKTMLDKTNETSLVVLASQLVDQSKYVDGAKWFFLGTNSEERMKDVIQNLCKGIKSNYASWIIGYESDADKVNKEKIYAKKLIETLLDKSGQKNLIEKAEYKI